MQDVLEAITYGLVDELRGTLARLGYKFGVTAPLSQPPIKLLWFKLQEMVERFHEKAMTDAYVIRATGSVDLAIYIRPNGLVVLQFINEKHILATLTFEMSNPAFPDNLVTRLSYWHVELGCKTDGA